MAPKLVLFSGSVQSACGSAQAAMGPFYCPADFAQAYVIAHEIGPHVQNLTGLPDQVQKARQRSSEAGANALSVRLELQADCFAGIRAHRADRLQQQSRGYVTPDSFTHGSAEQRVRWFRGGLESGQRDSYQGMTRPSL